MCKRNIYSFIFWTIIVCPFIVACHNDPIEIEREDVTINLVFNNVLTPFKAYADKDMQTYTSDGIKAQVNIVAFVYGDDGHLINSFQKTIADYNSSSISFNTNISGSNPRIVCFSYSSFKDSDGSIYNAYEITGQQMISTLKVENQLYGLFSIPWKVLGGAIATIGPSATKVDIPLTSLGSLIYLDFENIHAHDGDNPKPGRYAFMYKDRDVLSVKDGSFAYETSLTSAYYHLTSLYPAKHASYTSIYDFVFVLPGETSYFADSRYSPSNYVKDDDEVWIQSTDTKTINLQPGKQYLMKLDCSDFTVSCNEGILDW